MDKVKKEMQEDISQYFIKDRGCWIWNGSVDNRGYGIYECQGQKFQAHRSAAIVFGKRVIQPHTVLYQTCNNRLCCNPWHIRIREKNNTYDCMGKELMVPK